MQDAIAHSINSYAVQKDASQFKDKIGESVSSDLVTVEDDATNVKGLGASSFDREGIAHKRNVIIERGVLRKFIYNTYTAKKAGLKQQGMQPVLQIRLPPYQLPTLLSNQENQN